MKKRNEDPSCNGMGATDVFIRGQGGNHQPLRAELEALQCWSHRVTGSNNKATADDRFRLLQCPQKMSKSYGGWRNGQSVPSYF